MFESFLDRISFFGVKKKIDDDEVLYASCGRRFIGFLLDHLIIITFFILFSSISGYSFLGAHDFESSLELSFELFDTTFVSVIYYILFFFMIVWFWMRLGGTPGMLILGIGIVDEKTFSPITFRRAAKRFFIIMLFALLILPFLLGLIWAIFSKRNQTWHDIIAGTVVISKRGFNK